MITLVGDAGVGKSRLLSEFAAWAAVQPEPVCWFRGRATPQTASTPYRLLRDLFAERFHILESDSVAQARRKLREGLAEFLGPDGEMKAHFIGALIGYDFTDSPYLRGIASDARQVHDRALHYLAQFFTTVAQRCLAAVLLEDIHWADGPSLDVVRDVVGQLARDVRGAQVRMLVPGAVRAKSHLGLGARGSHAAGSEAPDA
jgi:predicted ATPase